MTDQQTEDKQLATKTESSQSPAQPEEKTSSWVLVLYILIPVVFLIAVTVWRAN